MKNLITTTSIAIFLMCSVATAGSFKPKWSSVPGTGWIMRDIGAKHFYKDYKPNRNAPDRELIEMMKSDSKIVLGVDYFVSDGSYTKEKVNFTHFKSASDPTFSLENAVVLTSPGYNGRGPEILVLGEVSKTELKRLEL